MTPAEALELIQEYVHFGRTRFTTHALRRMFQRNISRQDVYTAINTALSCLVQEDESWRVTGQDKEGDELTVIVSIEGGNVIITVY
jgi:hypothetical protein